MNAYRNELIVCHILNVIRFFIKIPLYISCSQCDKRFTNKPALQSHLRSHRPDDQRSHQCPYCSNKYATKGGLRSHLKSHENLREWKCRFCEKGFNNKEVRTSFHKLFLIKYTFARDEEKSSFDQFEYIQSM